MRIRLRRVANLAKEVNKSVEETTKILSARGIVVIDGFYDRGLFEALFNEPALLTKKRIEWGISHRLGIGAVKYLLDPLGIRIVVHDCRGSQWLMLRSENKNVLTRWQYANGYTSGPWCVFSVRNFLQEGAAPYYLFTVFDGPHAWAISTKTLVAAWDALKQGRGSKAGIEDHFSIPEGLTDHEGGALSVRVSVESHKFELKSKKQLGF